MLLMVGMPIGIPKHGQWCGLAGGLRDESTKAAIIASFLG